MAVYRQIIGWSLMWPALLWALEPEPLRSPPRVDGQAAARRDPADSAKDLAAVSVIGSGESRQVQRIHPDDQRVLPPGTSLQQVLNDLPGVNAQADDALGTNEQSMSISLRGFNATHLGYTLDGMPLGDSAYNNYNGLSINRALISENFAGAELSEGIGNLGTPSTSNLGGTIAYSSSDPAKQAGGRVVQSFGSDMNKRTFVRLDSGEYHGFSMYVSGMRATSDLWNHQQADKGSTNRQFNSKLVYDFSHGHIGAFIDTSRISQADNFYLSKNELRRGVGWNYGGYAPNWQRAVGKAYCNQKTYDAARCDSSGSDTDADGGYTAGQILRSDDLYDLFGDFFLSDSLALHVQGYHHEDKGEGNNWNSGSWSNQGQDDQLPIIFRDTLYSINRSGALLSLSWDIARNHLESGLWYEHNISTAARYNNNVTGPRNMDGYYDGPLDTGVFDQRMLWLTRQAYLQDSLKLFDDRLRLDAGFKSPHSNVTSQALPGHGSKPISPTSNNQLASGHVSADKAILPQVGLHYQLTHAQELFASYAKNIAMFQGGFKQGPLSVNQASWDGRDTNPKAEKSRSVEAGYRISHQQLQASLAAYKVRFDNRLLQYDPCDSRHPTGPDCGSRFYNVGGVNSHGVEVTVVWTPSTHWRWYNSLSYNRSTYANNYTAGGILVHTRGKVQTDTPDKLIASELTYTYRGFYATLRAKYTGQRYYTYTNDQGFGGFTVFDLGTGYDLGRFDLYKDVRLSLNITNLTNKRYASNLDSSAFEASDPHGTDYVFHASAPLQVFGSLDIRF